jgi:hypothetical protein
MSFTLRPTAIANVQTYAGQGMQPQTPPTVPLHSIVATVGGPGTSTLDAAITDIAFAPAP